GNAPAIRHEIGTAIGLDRRELRIGRLRRSQIGDRDQQGCQRKNAGDSRSRSKDPHMIPLSRDQFLLLSTILRSAIHGIMSRKRLPTTSISWLSHLARIALNEVWLTRFSSIQSLTNLPDWMSDSTSFIASLLALPTTRGPETYSPYSAVFDTE